MSDFQFYQTYGAAPGTDVPQGIGNGSNDWDFKNTDSPGAASASTAIRAGDFSYHVYVKGRFTQPTSGITWSSITNVKYYASVLNLSGYGTGAYILASGTETFVQPTSTSMSGTWDPIPEYADSGIDISTAGLAAGTEGSTDWVALQLKTGATGATPGVQSYQSFTIVWDEV